MCGIFGDITSIGRQPALSDQQAVRLRDLLTHRGPDGAGLWRGDGAILAHRRLAVIDPSPAGAQPMVTPDGRFALVYNGELYNDPEVRTKIQSAWRDGARTGFEGAGVDAPRFQSQCDSETVLHALALWGAEALAFLRGMYALALYDTHQRSLLLARDPLGVKPLYYWCDGAELIFASEPTPILAHPGVTAAPDMAMVSAYLTTIRTALGERTLFAGVQSVAPRSALVCDCSGERIEIKRIEHWRGSEALRSCADGAAAVRTREAVAESVCAHMRSDVPVCALLSGGLDSTITTALAMKSAADLRTYAAGSDDSWSDESSDLACARRVAQEFGRKHSEAILSRELFVERWEWMVEALGTPLSTPNEVAINAVARRLREDGCVVTISGEGADELFGGYDAPLESAWAYHKGGGELETGGMFELQANAWVPLTAKASLLNEDAMRAAEQDSWLVEHYAEVFRSCVRDGGTFAHPVDAHLRFHRRINLTGLLQRLDTATMLASVEGRTPFADRIVAALAESLPLGEKFEAGAAGGGEVVSGSEAAAVATHVRTRTKIALREGFAGAIPEFVVERAKMSFPLPFQSWCAGLASRIPESAFARELFTAEAVEAVAKSPEAHWRLAWPMINLAIWGERWWG